MLLTSMDTCGDPCPCRVCMTEWRLILFRIWDRNSKPNFACPGGRWSYDASYRWWYRPIAQQQLIWRKRCGMWTPMSCDLGKSVCRLGWLGLRNAKSKVLNQLILPIPAHTNRSSRWRPSSPIAYGCRTRSLARIHFQPWWRSRRRNRRLLESYQSDRKPWRWVWWCFQRNLKSFHGEKKKENFRKTIANWSSLSN